jgi:cell division protein FtsN
MKSSGGRPGLLQAEPGQAALARTMPTREPSIKKVPDVDMQPATAAPAAPAEAGRETKPGSPVEGKKPTEEKPQPGTERFFRVQAAMTEKSSGPGTEAKLAALARTMPPREPSARKVPDVDMQQATAAPAEAFPYSLYLGSVKTRELAKKGMAEYKKEGLSPYQVKVRFKEKGEWYRIFVGHFKDHAEAEAFARAKNLEGAEVFRTEYANLIGVYSQESAPQEIMRIISDQGCSPYAIPEAGGKVRLLVGAYVTRQAAEEFCNELKSSGVSSQVVRR